MFIYQTPVAERGGQESRDAVQGECRSPTVEYLVVQRDHVVVERGGLLEKRGGPGRVLTREGSLWVCPVERTGKSAIPAKSDVKTPAGPAVVHDDQRIALTRGHV
ncbi:MAG: hypothetical protein EBX50_14815 [Chitinophagia bacterium]|nr:hypothetical protein [Chitinophagia bacterium]